MKAEKEDRELIELFRNSLGNAEVIPDPSVNLKLMHQLARREFVTFNPARFNIYYLGGLIVAAVTAAIILLSDGIDGPPVTVDVPANESAVTSEIPLIEYPDTTAAKTYTYPDAPVNEEKSGGQPLAESENRKALPVIESAQERERVLVDHTDLNPDISWDDLFRNNVIYTDKLKSSGKAIKKEFISSVTEGCFPLKVRFINMASDFDSCRWTFGDGGLSYHKDPEWIFDVEGEYRVTLELFSSDKLVSTSSDIIKVYPGPLANFEIRPEKPVIPDDAIRFINYSAGAVRCLWDFGDGDRSDLFEPQHKYLRYGNYDVKLVVFNEYGCSDSIMVHNAFSGSAYFIEFPNAFIPNPDGTSGGLYSSKSDESAQVFHPAFYGVSEYQLKIFSKMGIIIFESNDINIGWDGYLNGQLSNPGVYIWKVRGKYRNGEPFIKMGDLTLLKY